MPAWDQILDEVRETGGAHDIVRRKYLKRLHSLTKRNVIAYYSGFLQKGRNTPGLDVNDSDKDGFMTVVHKLDRSKGLDLILHTPGGGIAATESLVYYLRQMFGTDIRAIVPQLAMSAGTMIACACKSVVMGKQSSLGPIDPQYMGVPAHGVVDEFEKAKAEVREDPSSAPLWAAILGQYPPTFVGECEHAMVWSREMVARWLESGMFQGSPNAHGLAGALAKDLGDHADSKSHDRHLHIDRCRELGLVIETLEDDEKLQDAVLSVHHAFTHTMSSTPSCKIIENHTGKAFIQYFQGN